MSSNFEFVSDIVAHRDVEGSAIARMLDAPFRLVPACVPRPPASQKPFAAGRVADRYAGTRGTAYRGYPPVPRYPGTRSTVLPAAVVRTKFRVSTRSPKVPETAGTGESAGDRWSN
eukprot:3472264-Rhodomonas_salina.3